MITCITNDALEDQNSTNGTYLNGQPVKKNKAATTTSSSSGKYRIKYILDDAKPGLAPSGDDRGRQGLRGCRAPRPRPCCRRVRRLRATRRSAVARQAGAAAGCNRRPAGGEGQG